MTRRDTLVDGAAEQAVIAACFADPTLVDNLATLDLADPKANLLAVAVGLVAETGDPLNQITVADHMRRNGTLARVGGEAAVAVLAMAAGEALDGYETHLRIVRDLARRRRVLNLAAAIEEGVWSEAKTEMLVDRVEQMLLEVAADPHRDTRQLVTLHEAAQRALDRAREIAERREAGDSTTAGVPSSLVDLNDLIDGWPRGQLSIVGARPAMGKSLLAGLDAVHAGWNAGRVLVVSAEMTAEELAARQLGHTPVGRLRIAEVQRGEIRDYTRWEQAVDALRDVPVLIDDASKITVADICATARRLARQPEGLAAVWVDYIGLLASDGSKVETRTLEIDRMAWMLRVLAKQLHIPVVVLAQLNRDLEKRAEKRPQLSDLRESGSLEQSAAVVVFLYRDEVYHEDTQEQGVIELIVAKNRFGPTGTVRAAFLPEFGQIANMARAY